MGDHCGYLEATSDCQLIAVSASKLGEVVIEMGGPILLNARKYANHFVEELNALLPDARSDVLESGLSTRLVNDSFGRAAPAYAIRQTTTDYAPRRLGVH